MNGFYKPVTDILRSHHFSYKGGGKGSHEKWSNGHITVLVPFNCKSRFTANAILKDAGLSERL